MLSLWRQTCATAATLESRGVHLEGAAGVRLRAPHLGACAHSTPKAHFRRLADHELAPGIRPVMPNNCPSETGPLTRLHFPYPDAHGLAAAAHRLFAAVAQPRQQLGAVDFR